MDFIIHKSHNYYKNDNVFLKYNYKNEKGNQFRFSVFALINTTNDFYINDNKCTVITSETDSYQIRPKKLYKNTKGVFYLKNSKSVYLTDYEYTDMLDYIKSMESILELNDIYLKHNNIVLGKYQKYNIDFYELRNFIVHEIITTYPTRNVDFLEKNNYIIFIDNDRLEPTWNESLLYKISLETLLEIYKLVK